MAQRAAAIRVFGVIALLLWAALGGTAAQVGFDRPGGDYRSVPIRSGDPEACAARCDQDGHCRAWTFAYPATVAPGATCWLKDRVPRALPHSCCVSGVKGGGLLEPGWDSLEWSIDRAGGDYRAFDVAPERGEAQCASACQAENRCRAWTYLRPGYLGSAARCFLKDRLTLPQRKPCCISGVVR